MDQRTNNKELRHDRHTVSLLTDHMVFAPKYRGKILVDEWDFSTVKVGFYHMTIQNRFDNFFFQYHPIRKFI